MKPFSLAQWLVAVGYLASCSTPFDDAPGSTQTNNGSTDSDGGGGALDSGVVDPGPALAFVQGNGPTYVRQGQTTNVDINVTRYITPGNNIQITATSKPNGVTVGSLTLAPGLSTGKLAITVDESVPQGELEIELQGLAAGTTGVPTTTLKLFVRGAPGTLDTTFASGGIYQGTEKRYSNISQATVQSDGTILVVAWPKAAQDPGAVIRLNADGVVDPDPTLSASDIENIDYNLNDAAAYPDGRIVTISATGYKVTRYTANGALDKTFNETGTPGTVTTSSSPPLPANWSYLYPQTLAVGQNNSIYAGGYAKISNNNAYYYLYAFVQISANGQGNMSGCSGFWGNAQTLATPYITHLSSLPTGALAFAGDNSVGVGVGRYNVPLSSCALDTAYGDTADGLTKTGTWQSTEWTYIQDAFFETDGSVDLLARKGASPSYVYSIVRIDQNGTLETKVDLPFFTSAYSITRAPDGRYIVAGNQSSASMAVAYYKTDLTLDTSIGNQNGFISLSGDTTLTNTSWYGVRAMYTPDGERTVVVGGLYGEDAINDPTGADHLVVARIWN